MNPITNTKDLEALYGEPVAAAITKVRARLTPLYRQWIDQSRFVVLSSVGPDGTDASPRGDDGAVVRIVDDSTILLPDWRGNNRIDSLRNIVVDGRVSLMFMIPGCNNVVRVNGTAVVTADETVVNGFERDGKHPRTVVVITVREVYVQCAKALMRSRLWLGEAPEQKPPTVGEFFNEVDPEFDGASYDEGYDAYAKGKMW